MSGDYGSGFTGFFLEIGYGCLEGCEIGCKEYDPGSEIVDVCDTGEADRDGEAKPEIDEGS